MESAVVTFCSSLGTLESACSKPAVKRKAVAADERHVKLRAESMNELTSEELQAPRTVAQFLPWVERRMEMEDVVYKETGNRDERLAKKLKEEALPLGIFASHHFGSSDDVIIALVLGNQSYDATIKDYREQKAPFSFIEVTQAHEGENEHLRMLALEREGHVSLLGTVHKSGTKNTGIHVEVEAEALSRSEMLKQELDRVEEAILRKTEKSYPPDTALLVVFEDMSIEDECDLETLHSRIQPLLPRLRNFRWLAVVGWSKRTFLEFDFARTAN
jgi:hypothetical protein